MAIDANGNSHKAAGRPDGGQFDRKTGQGLDDDLETPAEATLSNADAMLFSRREQASHDADATNGDDAWFVSRGRDSGYEYAEAIVDAARHAADIPEGTTLTDTAFDDETLEEYLEDLDSGSDSDDFRDAAGHAAGDAATPIERADRELKAMEDLAVDRMRGTYDDDSMHRAMGFASAIIDARDMLRPIVAIDRNGNNHKAAGHPDGGQFDRKAGQGSDDDLDVEVVDARRRVFDRIIAGDDGDVDLETARRIRYAVGLTLDRNADKVFDIMRRNGNGAMLDRYADR